MSPEPRDLVTFGPEIRIPAPMAARVAHHVRRSVDYRPGADPTLDLFLRALEVCAAEGQARTGNGTNGSHKTEGPVYLDTMSTREAADYLGRGPRWVRELTKRGRLDRHGRDRITRASVVAYADFEGGK